MSPIWKIKAPIFSCTLLFEKYFNNQVRINKTVNKHIVNYHPSPSELTSRIHSHISLDSQGVYLQNISLIFSSACMTWHHGCGKVQFFGVKITRKYIYDSRNWICSCLLMPPSKTLSQIFIMTEITHFPWTVIVWLYIWLF